MVRCIDGRANLRNPARDASRRFIVHDGDRLDGMPGISRELFEYLLRVDAMAPVSRYEIDPETQLRRHGGPQRGKVAGLEGKYPIAWRKRVDQRGFPRA